MFKATDLLIQPHNLYKETCTNLSLSIKNSYVLKLSVHITQKEQTFEFRRKMHHFYFFERIYMQRKFNSSLSFLSFPLFKIPMQCFLA